MKSYQTRARIVGASMLILIVLSFLVNMVMLGPVVFGEDYLTNISTNSDTVKISVLIELLNASISIGIAVLLVPVFLQKSKSLTYAYLGFNILMFTVIVTDMFAVLSLLSLSKEYVNQGSPATDYFQTLGALFYDIRWWTHYMTLLLSSLPTMSFYILIYRLKLVPKFISIWGMVSVPLLVLAVILAMFDQGTYMDLMAPLGFNQIFLGGWLVVKGFDSKGLKEGEKF